MPLDDLSVSDDLKRAGQAVERLQPNNLSKALAPASSSGSPTEGLVSKLPDALKAEETQQTEKRAAAGAAARSLEADQEARALLKAPLPPPPQHTPEPSSRDPWSNWASPAMALAMLASAFTRRPLTNALNAGAAVNEAYAKGDAASYKTAFERWKAETDYGIKLYEYQHEAYKDAIDTIDKDEKTALSKLKVLSSALNDEPMRRLADSVNIAGIVELDRQRRVATQQTQATLDHATEFAGGRHAELEAFDRLSAAQRSGDPQAIAEAQREYQIAQNRTKIIGLSPQAGGHAADVKLQQQDDLFQKLKADRVAKLKPGEDYTAAMEAEDRALAAGSIAGRGAATGKLSDSAADLIADQFILGDTQAITSQPRTGPIRVQIENRISEKLRDMPDAARQIALNRMHMAEARAAAATAGRVTMNTELFAQEAISAGKEVLLRSAEFPRSELPPVNTAIQSYDRNTGDPRIIRFGAALNAFVNAYGKLSNPTGTGIHDADKDRITKILDTSLSKGQIEAGINQIIREGQIVSNAAQSAQQEILERAVPRPGGQPAPAPTPLATPPPSPAGTTPPKITNQADYDNLPNGTRYLGPDGKTEHVKGERKEPQ